MEKLLNIIDNFLMRFVVIVIIMMTIIIILSVILRYLFGISYVWIQELIVNFFIITTFFGSVLGYKRNEHLAIDILYIRFPEKIKRILNIIFDILIIYLNWQIINVSIKWMNRVGNVVTPGMRVCMKYVYCILPISALLMIFYIAAGLGEKIKKYKFQE